VKTFSASTIFGAFYFLLMLLWIFSKMPTAAGVTLVMRLLNLSNSGTSMQECDASGADWPIIPLFIPPHTFLRIPTGHRHIEIYHPAC
jgi:hypothetical protein